jgi:DNA-binding MarR family transcriptional regulator
VSGATVEQTTTQPIPPASDPESLRAIGGTIAATCAGFNLRRASRAVTQHFDHALAPAGLRTTQFTLLGALALGGPCEIAQLAQALVMDRTTLTRNLKLLRDSGLVCAARSRAGRKIRFELTASGRATLAQAVPYWREAQDGIVAAFGSERWPGMVAELYRLVSGTLALDPNGIASTLDPAIAARGATVVSADAGNGATVVSAEEANGVTREPAVAVKDVTQDPADGVNGVTDLPGRDHTADQNV